MTDEMLDDAEIIELGAEAIRFSETLLPFAVQNTTEPRVALVGFMLAAAKLAVIFGEKGQPDARAEFIMQAGGAFDDELHRRKVSK